MKAYRYLFHELLQIWERILHSLENPLDKLNLLRSNCDLEEAFKLNEVDWLFAAVLPIIARKFKDRFYDKNWRKTFRACRVVSLSCSQALAECYREKSCWFLTPTLVNSQEIIDFSNFISLPNHSKTLIRSLHVSCRGNDADPYNPNNMQALLILLEKMGPYLLAFKLTSHSFPNVESQNEFLRVVLLLLPNLRQFLYFTQLTTNGVGGDKVSYSTWLPHLPYLKKLCLAKEKSNGRTCIPSMSFENYFPQIISLTLDFCFWFDDAYNRKGLFPNLRYITLKRIPFMKKGIVDRLTSLLMNLEAPKLKRLSLEFKAKTDKFKSMRIRMICVEQIALIFLRKSHPNKDWKSCNSGRRRKQMHVRLYSTENHVSEEATHMTDLGLKGELNASNELRDVSLQMPTSNMESSLIEPKSKLKECCIVA